MSQPDLRGQPVVDPLAQHHDTRGAWHPALRAALSSAFTAGVVTGGIYLLSELLETARAAVVQQVNETDTAVAEEPTPDEESIADPDDHVVEAARLLGVSIDAGESEIRAALRARFKDTALHPDHGGNPDVAQELIAAKNLLVERARAVTS